MLRLLLATTNRGKVAEYGDLLKGLDIELLTLDQVGISQEAEENYATYADNARSKAEFYSALSGLITLADDSGLEVDALGGEPGVRSARYAGDNASDADRVNFLLDKLTGVRPGDRTARFRCVIAVSIPGSSTHIFEGECPGTINMAPAGDNGFGYDPVFFLPEYGKTIAQVTPELKNEISHRGRAAQKARPFLETLSQ